MRKQVKEDNMQMRGRSLEDTEEEEEFWEDRWGDIVVS
jgi:hypothetical protein